MQFFVLFVSKVYNLFYRENHEVVMLNSEVSYQECTTLHGAQMRLLNLENIRCKTHPTCDAIRKGLVISQCSNYNNLSFYLLKTAVTQLYTHMSTSHTCQNF